MSDEEPPPEAAAGDAMPSFSEAAGGLPADAPPLFSLQARVAVAVAAAVVVPAVLALVRSVRAARSAETTLDDIFASRRDLADDDGADDEDGDGDGAAGGGGGGGEVEKLTAAVDGLPWPPQLPGLDAIVAYETLKDELVRSEHLSHDARADIGGDDSAFHRLRMALMDRCQARENTSSLSLSLSLSLPPPAP